MSATHHLGLHGARVIETRELQLAEHAVADLVELHAMGVLVAASLSRGAWRCSRRGSARDAYIAARRRAAQLEVVLRSPSPAVLGLPWELMRDDARPSHRRAGSRPARRRGACENMVAWCRRDK